MTELTRMSVPLISDRSLQRLLNFARPARLDAKSTAFDTGYERCKQDLMDLLAVEAGTTRVTSEQHIPEALETKVPWWRK